MVAIYQTAYPRIKKNLTERDLGDIYTPTIAEKKFALKYCKKQSAAYFGLLVQLKMLQRLGRFTIFKEIPLLVIKHIKQSINTRVTEKQLKNYWP